MHDLNANDVDLPVDLPIETRVKAGMALLDEKYGPEWVEAIDVESLDLQDNCSCVLGQLEGEFNEGLSKVFNLPLGSGFAPVVVDSGFNADRADIWARMDEYPELTTVWKAAILARRAELAS